MINLRPFISADAPALLQLLNNTNVTRYLSSRLPTPYTAEDAQWWINTGSKVGTIRAIEVEQAFIGCVGAEPGIFEQAHAAEIGYWIGEPYWGRGYVSQALAEMTECLFAQDGITRLFAPVFDPNLASMRVLEKCGYQREGIARKGAFKNGQYYDKHIFSKLKA